MVSRTIGGGQPTADVVHACVLSIEEEGKAWWWQWHVGGACNSDRMMVPSFVSCNASRMASCSVQQSLIAAKPTRRAGCACACKCASTSGAFGHACTYGYPLCLQAWHVSCCACTPQHAHVSATGQLGGRCTQSCVPSWHWSARASSSMCAAMAGIRQQKRARRFSWTCWRSRTEKQGGRLSAGVVGGSQGWEAVCPGYWSHC